MQTTNISTVKNHLLILMSFTLVWFTFFYNCIDVKDWFIENILVFIILIGLIFTYKKNRFTTISYICILAFAILHIYGAQYAYTQNPLGKWLQSSFHLLRNPYDRIVHFSFGFCLLIPIKEILVKQFAAKEKYLNVLTINVILSLATIFELIEWTVAELTTKETGETYVATQGDVWDAHKDIIMAVIGGYITIIIFKAFKKIRKQKLY
jgi:putative membrane protein